MIQTPAQLAAAVAAVMDAQGRAERAAAFNDELRRQGTLGDVRVPIGALAGAAPADPGPVRDEHGRFAAAPRSMSDAIRELVNGAAPGDATPEFTQADVDQAVQDRLGREQAEYADLQAKAARLDALEAGGAA